MKDFASAALDAHLLQAAQERTNLASKIIQCNTIESRASRNNNWYVNAAKDADVELDDDLLDKGQSAGDLRDRQRFAEAKKAKQELTALLAKPMLKQNFSKFLGGPGAQAALKAQHNVLPRALVNDKNDNHVSKKERTLKKAKKDEMKRSAEEAFGDAGGRKHAK